MEITETPNPLETNPDFASLRRDRSAFRSPKMKAPPILVFLGLLLTASCSPPKSSEFLAGFNPIASLNTVGAGSGVSYAQGSAGSSMNNELLGGTRFHKYWSVSFSGSHSQLDDQLDRFRAEVERQLSAGGGTISGRGKWSGDFSGFSFDYSSGERTGFLRVTGASVESSRQALEIVVYEH
jgi:hypothetical protein